MATFCVGCGTPLGESTAFCPKCGQVTGNRPNPVPYTSVAPATKGGSAMKIIIVLLCCLAVGGIVVVGAVVYVAHRVKQAVVHTAAENGVDLNSLSVSSGDSGRALPKSCDLLSRDEVSRLIGQPIERAETKNGTCEFYGPAGLSAKLAQEEGTDQLDRAKTAGADPKMNALEVQRMLNRMGAANGNTEAGSTGSGGELPLLVLNVSANGKSTMMALNLTKALVGAAGKSAAGQQGETSDAEKNKSIGYVFVGSQVDGLGDKAMWTPQHGLYVLKGDTLLQVNPCVMPDFSNKGVAVARAVLPKI